MMDFKKRFLFRGFYEDPQGEKTIYINGRAVRGRWLHGNLKLIDCGGEVRCYIRSYGRTGHSWKVIPETVSQFTGQYAKKKRIFEHDLLHFTDDDETETYHVRWNEKLCRFEAVWKEDGVADDLDDFFAERAEVIGTVFGRRKENGIL